MQPPLPQNKVKNVKFFEGVKQCWKQSKARSRDREKFELQKHKIFQQTNIPVMTNKPETKVSVLATII